MRLFQGGQWLAETNSSADGNFCLEMPGSVTPPNLPVVARGTFKNPPVDSINLTGEDGVAVLPGLAAGKKFRIVASRPRYADDIEVLSFPADGGERPQLEIPRACETIIEGEVRWNGAPVQGWTNGSVKFQTWGGDWRRCVIGPDGHDEVRDVPSLKILGASAERDEKTERRIYYALGPQRGLRDAESEPVRQDFEFQPMALIRGLAPGRTAVWYLNSHSICGA